MFNLSSGNTSEMLAVGICTWWFGMMEGGRGVLGRGARNLRDAWVAKDMEIGLGPRVASGDILLYCQVGKHKRYFRTLGPHLVLVYVHLYHVTIH